MRSLTRRPSSPQAFTLIELVASAVLTSLMMAGLLGVVWSAVRETRQLERAESNAASTTLLADRIRTDFQNARGMSVTPTEIRLHGFLGGGTSGTRQMPGSVTYRVGDRILFRVDGGGSQPVWWGVGSIAIDILERASNQRGSNQRARDSDSQSLDRRVDPTGGLPPIPAAFRIDVRDEAGNPIFGEVIHHHAAT